MQRSGLQPPAQEVKCPHCEGGNPHGLAICQWCGRQMYSLPSEASGVREQLEAKQRAGKNAQLVQTLIIVGLCVLGVVVFLSWWAQGR